MRNTFIRFHISSYLSLHKGLNKLYHNQYQKTIVFYFFIRLYLHGDSSSISITHKATSASRTLQAVPKPHIKYRCKSTSLNSSILTIRKSFRSFHKIKASSLSINIFFNRLKIIYRISASEINSSNIPINLWSAPSTNCILSFGIAAF